MAMEFSPRPFTVMSYVVLENHVSTEYSLHGGQWIGQSSGV